jgi:hypothetical protein
MNLNAVPESASTRDVVVMASAIVPILLTSSIAEKFIAQKRRMQQLQQPVSLNYFVTKNHEHSHIKKSLSAKSAWHMNSPRKSAVQLAAASMPEQQQTNKTSKSHAGHDPFAF